MKRKEAIEMTQRTADTLVNAASILYLAALVPCIMTAVLKATAPKRSIPIGRN